MRLLACRKALEKLMRTPRLFVVYHWDADGVASAALVLRHLGVKVVGLSVPRIGLYSADAMPLPRASASLLVLDYGLPGPVYEEVAERRGAEIIVVDHHRVTPPRGTGVAYCNPVAAGLGSEEDYPANSTLVYQLLGSPSDSASRVLAALGVAGDLAPYIDSGRPHRGLRAASALLRGMEVSLQELRALAESIDSCYRLLDEECLVYAARKAAKDPLGLMSDERLREARRRAARLLDEAVEKTSPIYEDEVIKAYLLVMDAYVTSALGRRLAASNPDKVVALVHYMPSQGRGTIYVRSIARGLSPVADKLRSRGIRVAGKTNVIVIEYRGEEYRKLLSELVKAVNETM